MTRWLAIGAFSIAVFSTTAAAAEGDGCLTAPSSTPGALAAQPETGALFLIKDGRLWRADQQRFVGAAALPGIGAMAFDPRTGALYAVSEGRSLVQIDPHTGALIPEAFGPGQAHLLVQGLKPGELVRGLAIDPLDGNLFAAVAGVEGRLLRLGRATGESVEVGALQGVDALSIDSRGQLFAASSLQQQLFTLDKDTARQALARPLSEASPGGLTCLCDGPGVCAMDIDGDGLNNAREAHLGTDPALSDTDGDGLSDFAESQGGRFIDRNYNDLHDALEKPRLSRAADPPVRAGGAPLSRGASSHIGMTTTAMACATHPAAPTTPVSFAALVLLGLSLLLTRRLARQSSND